MNVTSKQGTNERKISIFGYEHPDLATKFATAIDGAGEQLVVGRTTKFEEDSKTIVKPQGTDTELVPTDIICKLESGNIVFVTGPFPILKKDITPITTRIKSSCSIGGSRVIATDRKLKSESL